MKNNSLGAIILAAGKGKRMNAKTINKVVYPLANRPMILHIVELFEALKINPIIVIIGFAKKSVMDILNDRVLYVEQKKRLGTGHAAYCGIKKIPDAVKNILIVNGDDSAFYGKKVISQLFNKHLKSDAVMTFLTINLDNPFGLGRVIRNNKKEVIAIVEEKDATEEQKKIKEINPACYIFKTAFLKKYLSKIKKSPVTKEYYLVSLIELAVKNQQKLQTMEVNNLIWRGVNTKEELIEAERLFLQKK